MKKKGFTLIELVVVMALVAILISTASISAKKRIDKNNFLRMKTVIPEIFLVGEHKAFNDGEMFSILFDLSNSRLVTSNKVIDIPEYYKYSFYNVVRDPNGVITGASLLSSTEDFEFLTNKAGLYDKMKKSSDATYTDTSSTNHGAILVTKASDSSVVYRLDIIPYSVRTTIKRYLPNGATASSVDVADELKWAEE